MSVPRGEEGGALPQASLTPPGDGDDDDDGSVNGDDDGDYDGDDDGEPAGSSAGTGRPSSPSASGRQLSRNGPTLIFARSATTRLKNGATGLCWVAMCQCSKMWCLVQSLVRFGINLVHNGYDMKSAYSLLVERPCQGLGGSPIFLSVGRSAKVKHCKKRTSVNYGVLS